MVKLKVRQHLENPIKYMNVLVKKRIKCKCGHSTYIPPELDKVICSWCGNYVFKDNKKEFEYRFKEARNNGK